MANAIFRVRGRFIKASQEQEAIVTIERSRNLVTIRPVRSGEVFEVTLDKLCSDFVRESLMAKARSGG